MILNKNTFSSILLLIISLFVCNMSSEAQGRTNIHDPGHKEDAFVGKIRFSVPNQFNRLENSDKNFSFIKHEKHDLTLFVAQPEKPITEDYYQKLLIKVTTAAYPNEKTEYSWKTRENPEKVSKYEVENAHYDGFNGSHAVAIHYRQLKVNGTNVIVGYVYSLAKGEAAKLFFEHKASGNSMVGWYSQAHVISSITGEKYEEVYPDRDIRGVTPPPMATPKKKP